MIMFRAWLVFCRPHIGNRLVLTLPSMCMVQFQRKFDKFVSLDTLKEHKDSELAGDSG